MSATHTVHSTPTAAPVLYVAFELGWRTWKMAFTVGAGQPPRIRTVPARCTSLVLNEIKKAKLRFGLPANAPVVSCYEAGRDGFWIHRFLRHEGIQNIVVDSASIEVSRRKRRAKSDRLDAIKLVSMLIRWHNGEKKVWSVVHVPTVADEDRRQLHRELIELKAERTELLNRIKGLLAGLGLSIVVDAKLPGRLGKLRQWDDAAVPPALKATHPPRVRAMAIGRAADPRAGDRAGTGDSHRPQPAGRANASADEPQGDRRERGVAVGSRVLRLATDPQPSRAGEPGGVGTDAVRQRRQPARARDQQGRQPAGAVDDGPVGVGLVAVPAQERAEPWYQRRFGQGKSRMRKVGIVALARKLLIALWKYLETGEVPAGAEVQPEERSCV